jgi:hypothetical protein
VGVLIKDRGMDLPSWALDNRKRRSSEFDGWSSEVLHDLAKAEIKKFAKAIAHHGFEHIHEQFDQDFIGLTILRPQQFEILIDDGFTQASRAKGFTGDLYPASRAAELTHDLLTPFDEGVEIHPFVKIISVDIRDDDYFSTEVLGHFSAPTATGGRFQQNIQWNAEWRVRKEGGESVVRMFALRASFCEELKTQAPLLEDLTGAVFGDMAHFRSEYLHGVNEYMDMTDRLIGNSFIGAQGFAVGDVNQDGRDDLYVCQQGGLPNRLFTHSKDGRARDKTQSAGVGFLDNSRSALFLDLDNDGDQDLIVAVGANLMICWNDGTGQFNDLTPVQGDGDDEIYSLSAADIDADGDLDLYAVRYTAGGIIGGVPTPYHDANNGASNMLWRNLGDRKFSLATAEVGLNQNNSKFSLSSLWEDYDDDGDLDLYVTNDFGHNNLYRNDGGNFIDVAGEIGASDLAAGMGISAADIDGDGDMDYHVSNMFSSAGRRIVPQSDQFMQGKQEKVHEHYLRHARGNTLLENLGDGTFRDITLDAGIAVGGWAWGARMGDLSGDGLPDIYSPNGFVTNTDTHDL